MRKPELLAPGGSFDAAFQAFEAGADGVYLGLTEFSARKAAANFTLEQLRRIRTLAADRGRRVYVALNTVIRDEEMPRLAQSLAWLEALSVDGVIVQDLGTCRLIREGFPCLPVHASTQMAIHNDGGLRMAEELGIRRVILSRELPFEAIRDLRLRHPGIELEVFIHGALCYSFSGVCLASWALTGRSGNRGDCAQICRSLFHPKGDRPSGSFFSSRDLALGPEVLKLAGIGINALKIEGRMKSPEYVFHVTRLYRAILDRGEDLPAGDLEELLRSSELTFSREKTTGWFESPRGTRLLEPGFPGHRGTALGTAAAIRGQEITLRLLRDVSLHDGVGYWPSGARDPLIFPVRRITRGGKQVRFARAGETVSIPCAETAGDPPPTRGAEIRLFSSRFLDRPLQKETAVAPMKVPVDLAVTIGRDAQGGVFSCAAEGDAAGFSFSRRVALDSSSGGRPFIDILGKILGESGASAVTLGRLSLVNATGLGDAEIFIPPSELKRAKNELYSALDAFLASALEKKAGAACAMTDAPARAASPGDSPALSTEDLSTLSHRELLSPRSQRPIPFLAAGAPRPEELFSLGGFLFLPLPPVCMNDREWPAELKRLSSAHPGARFAVGLSNVGHLALADELASTGDLYFFIDYYLYAANRRTVSFLEARVPRLLFIYSWIEGDEGNHRSITGSGSRAPLVRIDASYTPPLFYSLGCLLRHGRGGGECLDGCPKDHAEEMRQGRNSFRVIVKDCVTYLFQEK